MTRFWNYQIFLKLFFEKANCGGKWSMTQKEKAANTLINNQRICGFPIYL